MHFSGRQECMITITQKASTRKTVVGVMAGGKPGSNSRKGNIPDRTTKYQDELIQRAAERSGAFKFINFNLISP
jgi:hypothetical protein